MRKNKLTTPCEPTASLLEAALMYRHCGWSVLPLRGKRPAIHWKPFQRVPAVDAQIMSWHHSGLLKNIGIVCGTVSRNLVVMDIDSEAGYAQFAARFPDLTTTYTVRTGSGVGWHLYWYVENLPRTTRIRSQSFGGLELLASGCQVVAPPSIHPVTQNKYQLAYSMPIQPLKQVNVVRAWLQSLKEPVSRPTKRHRATVQPRCYPSHVLLRDTLVAYFSRHNYRLDGEWLNGRCVYPHHHRNGDVHPSFGLNTQTGYGFCFVCGSMSPVELCEALNLQTA